MARSIRGGDWIAVAAEQKAACSAANGFQLSGTLGLQSSPFTPGEFARQTFRFWNDAAVPVARAAQGEGKSIPLSALGLPFAVDELGRPTFQAPPAPADGGMGLSPVGAALATSEDIAVKQAGRRIDASLRTMLACIAAASTARDNRGNLALSPVDAARFWDAVELMGLDYSFLAARTSISAGEYWTAVKEGAKDGLRNVGEVAGSALAAAGEGVGIAVGGLFSGLGVVNTLVVVGGVAGGAYLISRKVI